MGVLRLGLLIVVIAIVTGCGEHETIDPVEAGADEAVDQTQEPTPAEETAAMEPETDPRELLFELHDRRGRNADSPGRRAG